MGLPDLGVGLVALPGLGPFLGQLYRAPSVIEIEPQAYWSQESVGSALRTNLDRIDQVVGNSACLIHSVELAVGGLAGPDPRQWPALIETLDHFDPSWWSDHAAILATETHHRDRRNFGFLMPPVQTDAAVGMIADRIKSYQDRTGRPFAFETGVNYFQPIEGELSDGQFWGEIADRADCGILLDLHNIWTNERNQRSSLASTLADMPLERVWELHLADGQERKGFWLDAHSGLPQQALLDIAHEWVPRLTSLHAILFEIIPDYVEAFHLEASDFDHCLAQLEALWDRRGIAIPSLRAVGSVGSQSASLPGPVEWEGWLANGLSYRSPLGPLIADPAMDIYRDLIGAARRGIIVDALPFSARFLLRSIGEEQLNDAFEDYLDQTPPRSFAAEEASAFADFAKRRWQLVHFHDLLAFEVAGHRATISGQDQYIPFSCDPESFLSSIARGEWPPCVQPGSAIVRVTPPTGIDNSQLPVRSAALGQLDEVSHG